MLTIIAAIGKNREIGKQGDLCFHIKEDLSFFRTKTTGHKVVMGRKTWESLPGKLPDRTNIVISHREFPGPDTIIHDLDSFISENQNTDEEIFIIGGSAIYQHFLPYAKTLYLTEVDATVDDATAFFPAFDHSKYDKIILKKGSEDGLKFQIILYSLT